MLFARCAIHYVLSKRLVFPSIPYHEPHCGVGWQWLLNLQVELAAQRCQSHWSCLKILGDHSKPHHMFLRQTQLQGSVIRSCEKGCHRLKQCVCWSYKSCSEHKSTCPDQWPKILLMDGTIFQCIFRIYIYIHVHTHVYIYTVYMYEWIILGTFINIYLIYIYIYIYIYPSFACIDQSFPIFGLCSVAQHPA